MFFSKIRRRLAAALSAAIVLSAQPYTAQHAAAAESPDEQLTLPVISLETVDGWGYIKDEYVDAGITVWDENGRTDLSDTAVRVRLRGNSSRSVPKKSYKLHFPDKANPLQTGKGKAKTWVLTANYYDASLLRNWTALQIGAKLDGLPYTPRCRSAELYVDGEYYGVYLLTEAVSVNKHRVHITEAPDQIADNGYLLEMTRYAKTPSFLVDCFRFEVKSTLSGDEETAQQQVDYISGYTEEALRALKSGEQAAAAQYLDIRSLVDNCIVNEICKNVDVGWDSYYLSKDAGGKLTFHPVWDFDIAFGNCLFTTVYTAVEGEGMFALSDSTADCNPWLCYAMRCAWFRDLLKERWAEMRAAFQELPAEILAEAKANSAAYQRNFDRLSAQMGFMPGNDPSVDYNTHMRQAELLADWVSARIGWLDAYYDTPEFAEGIFPDEKGKALPVTNALAVSQLSNVSEYTDCTDLCYTGHAGGLNDLARFGGLMLAAGQTYQLSFACSTDGTAEIECRIRTEDENFTESFAVTAEPQTVVFPFTPHVTDMQADVSLSLTGSGTVQVSHLALTRQDSEPVRGDLNRDGRCDMADVCLLRDWLICQPDAAISDWQAADLNGDGRLDACDLSLLKQFPAA